MALVKTKDAKVGLYGAFPADMVYGLLLPLSNITGTNGIWLGLYSEQDAINFTSASGIQFGAYGGGPYIDIASGISQSTGNFSFTNTATANLFTATTTSVKPTTATSRLVAGGMVFAVVTIVADNNTSGDTTYWTPYLTINYTTNGIVTNIVPKTNLGANSTTATSATFYGQILTYILPNDIVIPPNSRIQAVIEVDAYVSAGTGLAAISFSSGSDLSGNGSSPGTWFSLPVEVE